MGDIAEIRDGAARALLSDLELDVITCQDLLAQLEKLPGKSRSFAEWPDNRWDPKLISGERTIVQLEPGKTSLVQRLGATALEIGLTCAEASALNDQGLVLVAYPRFGVDGQLTNSITLEFTPQQFQNLQELLRDYNPLG